MQMPFNPIPAARFMDRHPLPWSVNKEPVSEAERVADARELSEFVAESNASLRAEGRGDVADLTGEDFETSYNVVDAHKYVVRDANGAAISTDSLLSDALVSALYRSLTGADRAPTPLSPAGPNEAAHALLSAVATLFTAGSVPPIAQRYPDRLRRHVDDLEEQMHRTA